MVPVIVTLVSVMVLSTDVVRLVVVGSLGVQQVVVPASDVEDSGVRVGVVDTVVSEVTGVEVIIIVEFEVAETPEVVL